MVVCYGIGNSKHVHISDFKQGLRNFFWIGWDLFLIQLIYSYLWKYACLIFLLMFNVHDHELSKLHDCTLWWHLTIAKSWLGNNNFEICY